MSIIKHSKRFQGRADELRTEKKQRLFKGIILMIISIIVIIIIASSYSTAFPLRKDQANYLFFVLMLLPTYSIGLLIAPLSDYNQAFLNIVESMEILEKSGTTSKSNDEAYKKILNAYSKLVQKPRKPWLTEIRKIEQEFLKNLKYRVAPAVKDNTLNPGSLADIIRAMQSTDINSLSILNEQLLAQYEEQEIIERSIRNISISILNKFIGKVLISAIISSVIPIALIYAITQSLQLDFLITIKNNIITVIALFVASTIGILNMIKDREFT